VISAPSTRRYTVVLSLGVVSRSQQLCQTCWPRRSCQDLDVDVCAAPFPLLGLRRLSQILQTCKISELWLHLHDYGITGSGEDNYHLHSHPAPQSLLDRRCDLSSIDSALHSCWETLHRLGATQLLGDGLKILGNTKNVTSYNVKNLGL
jgi:hypothetical protein